MARQRKTAIDEEIDRNLKRAFDDLTQQPLPDNLMQLIDRLRREENAASRQEDDASDAQGDS